MPKLRLFAGAELCNFLSEHGFERVRQRGDFTVYTPAEKPVYIEYWGLLDDPEYVSRKNRKCEIYARYRFPLLELHKHELQNLDFYMQKKLRDVGITPQKN
jgi:hypothetical protein